MMKMKRIGFSSIAFVFLMAAGCATRATFSENMRTVANQWDKGNKLSKDGEEMIKKGEQQQRQAEELMATGKSTVAKGEEKVKEGKFLIETVEREHPESLPQSR
jgi:hypothetical protein